MALPVFAGRFFSTADPTLADMVAQLDSRAVREFPQLADGSIAGLLRLRPIASPRGGRGLFLADEARLDKDTCVALYHGDISAQNPAGAYVADLGTFRRHGVPYDLSVDAGVLCRQRRPPLTNAGLFNHTCSGATVYPRYFSRWPIPCIAAFVPAGTPPGSQLCWSYDGGRPGSAYTLSAAAAARVAAGGTAVMPCCCASPDPCPRQRWLLQRD
jgi:hypothetical protein